MNIHTNISNYSNVLYRCEDKIKIISIRLTYTFCSLLCQALYLRIRCLVTKIAFSAIFNTLSIFLTPRKYLILCFEIMTASQMEKATMLLIYVYHNYCFLYWFPRLFTSYLQACRQQLWCVIYKMPKECLNWKKSLIWV